MNSIVIADFGTGNLHSVQNAFEAIGRDQEVIATRDADKIGSADRLVLPGQGAIGTFMSELANDEVRDALQDALRSKPVLGICLGLQAMYETSEEDGGVECLGALSGKVRRFDPEWDDAGRAIKIPHMGWSEVRQQMRHPLWQGIRCGSRFYFVHSYYVDASIQSQVAGTTAYGTRFTCAAAQDNLFAVQFHPEKSRGHGLKLLENFASWDGQA